MHISEVMPHGNGNNKRVGVHFDQRSHAMTAAVKLYRDHGIDVEIQDNDVWIETVRPMALPVMQLLERATGIRGFNEWESA